MVVLRDHALQKRVNGLNEAKNGCQWKIASEGKARDKAVSKMRRLLVRAEKWLRGYQMAESTRDMRRSYIKGVEVKICPEIDRDYT